MKFLSVGQVLPAVRAGVFMGIATVQSVSQSAYGERQAGAGGGADRGHEAGDGTGQERGAVLKGLSPVSNSSQRDYTMLSSLFNLRLKRGLFVSLVFHCFLAVTV